MRNAQGIRLGLPQDSLHKRRQKNIVTPLFYGIYMLFILGLDCDKISAWKIIMFTHNYIIT